MSDEAKIEDILNQVENIGWGLAGGDYDQSNKSMSVEEAKAQLLALLTTARVEQIMQDEQSLGLELPITDESQLIEWRLAQLKQTNKEGTE